jgi:hypothetical protein
MSRPKLITIAAILLLLLSLMNAASDVPFLLQGPAAAAAGNDVGSYAWAVVNFTYSVAGLVAAFALWRNLRWGKALALIVSALSILNLLIGVFSGQLDLFPIVIGSMFIVLYLFVVVLVLQYAPAPAESGL